MPRLPAWASLGHPCHSSWCSCRLTLQSVALALVVHLSAMSHASLDGTTMATLASVRGAPQARCLMPRPATAHCLLAHVSTSWLHVRTCCLLLMLFVLFQETSQLLLSAMGVIATTPIGAGMRGSVVICVVPNAALRKSIKLNNWHQPCNMDL